MVKKSMRMNVIKDNSAQGGAVSFFVGAMIAVIVALQVAWPVMDASIYGGEAEAAGTLTWSGNGTNGSYVNFTYSGGNYNFCYGVGGSVCASGIPVTLPIGKNGTSDTANATADRINANTTLAGVLTATNSSAGVVTITYDTKGIAGNYIGTTTNASGAAWGATTLTGGGNRVTQNMSTSATTLVDQLPLFLVLVLLMVFVRAVI